MTGWTAAQIDAGRAAYERHLQMWPPLQRLLLSWQRLPAGKQDAWILAAWPAPPPFPRKKPTRTGRGGAS